MANFNKIILMGRLTKDPKIEYNENSGNARCEMRLATSRTWRNRNGEEQEDRLFIDITVFGRQAENCAKFLKKGREVLVEGRLSMFEWEDRETGKRQSKYSVNAERVQFIGGRPSDEEGGEGGGGGRGYGRNYDNDYGGGGGGGGAKSYGNKYSKQSSGRGGGGGGGYNDEDDDVPF